MAKATGFTPIEGVKGPFNTERSVAGIEPPKYLPKIGNGRPTDDGMVDGDDRMIPASTGATDDLGESYTNSLAGMPASILKTGYQPISGISGATQSDGMEEA